jgi:hypothetical protein
MRYRIEQTDARLPSGDYRYRIWKGSRLIAHYWHDYRGDEHGVELLDGASTPVPGGVGEFLEGGGPSPLTLSERAMAFLDALVAASEKR